MATMIKELARHTRSIRAVNRLPIALSGLSLLMLFCSLFLLASYARAGDVIQKFVPGMYEGLMLAVDHDGHLTGFYREAQGQGPTKTCSFFLGGQDTRGQAIVTTWNDLVLPGLLAVAGKDLKLKIERGREHPGCGLVLLPEVSTGITLERTSEAQWNTLKMVQNTRAQLFSEPSFDKKSKSYFIKNDVLGIVAVSGEWLKVEFPREGKPAIKGWVRSSDTQNLPPPRN